MSQVKISSNGEPAKPKRFPKAVAALILIVLGGGVSLHLHANHVSHWWLPFVLIAITHGAIIAAILWIFTRRRQRAVLADSAASQEDHNHVKHSHVIRTPRLYDWLVRMLTFGGEHKFRLRTLDLAELQLGETVLDVGCGTGTLLIEAAKRVGKSGCACGIEPSSEMIAHARHKAEIEAVKVEVQEAFAEHLPFSNALFDVVLCTMVLHHLPTVTQTVAIGEMRRVLRPGGRIVIVDMQRPRSLSTALSLITLFHAVGSHASAPDWQKIELLLRQQGIQNISKRAIWGSSVASIVGRI